MPKITLILALVYFLGLAAGAFCGNQEQTLVLATGSPGGVYFGLGNDIAEVTRKYGITIKSEATGGSLENVERIRNRQAHLALVQSDVAFYAFAGRGIFLDKDQKNLRGIASLYTETVQILVRPSLILKSISELRGKRRRG